MQTCFSTKSQHEISYFGFDIAPWVQMFKPRYETFIPGAKAANLIEIVAAELLFAHVEKLGVVDQLQVALSSYQAWNQNQFLLIAIQGDQMSL
jgi:hypothetical protein